MPVASSLLVAVQRPPILLPYRRRSPYSFLLFNSKIPQEQVNPWYPYPRSPLWQYCMDSLQLIALVARRTRRLVLPGVCPESLPTLVAKVQLHTVHRV